MRATTIVDREDELLQGLPLAAQLLYIRVLRKLMDDQTGISGGRRGALITMGRCSDTLEIEAHRGLTESGKPNRHKINRLLKWLEKAGLIVRRQNPDWPDSMIFFLPVAFEAISEWREWRKMKMEQEAEKLRAVGEAAQAGSGKPNPKPAPYPTDTRATQQPTEAAAAQGLRQSETEKPDRKPSHTRPKANPPPPSPVDQFYERFQQDTPEKRSTAPAADTSAQNKPAPKPDHSQSERKPNPEVAKALRDAVSVSRESGGKIRFNLKALLKAAPSSVNLGDSFNVAVEPAKKQERALSEMSEAERIELSVAHGIPRDVAEALAVQRARLEEGAREWKARNPWPALERRY